MNAQMQGIRRITLHEGPVPLPCKVLLPSQCPHLDKIRLRTASVLRIVWAKLTGYRMAFFPVHAETALEHTKRMRAMYGEGTLSLKRHLYR